MNLLDRRRDMMQQKKEKEYTFLVGYGIQHENKLSNPKPTRSCYVAKIGNNDFLPSTINLYTVSIDDVIYVLPNVPIGVTAVRIHCNEGFNSNVAIWDGVGSLNSHEHRVFDTPWLSHGWHEFQISQYSGNFILLMFRKPDNSSMEGETEETIGADYEFVF